MIHPYSYYLARAAAWWPDKTAIVDGPRSLTYRELDRRVGSLAAGLRELGLRSGDRVAIIQENNHRYVEAVSAVARTGGVLVPMMGAFSDREHEFILEDSEASFAIALSPEGAERAERLRRRGGSFRIVAPGCGAADYQSVIESHQPEDPRIEGDPDDLAQILYTSGTTGRPKGVMHSFQSTGAGIGAWVTGVGIQHEDRLLGHFALSHFGGRVMDSSIAVGATLVVLPRPDVPEILATIARQRITVLLMVPTLMQMTIEDPAIGRCDLSSLRMVLYAAAPASPSLVRRAFETLGPILVTGFGQTEAYGLNTFLSAEEHRRALEEGSDRLGSIGREAMAWVQLRLLGPDGAEVPQGEVGEICVSAPWVMKGYWKLDELTRKTLKDGWLHTGDMARRDAEGYFYIADRKQDMIISGGFNVYPREVEDVISTVPGVRECCVVGVPDAKWGEAVTAVVVAPGVDPDRIISHCTSNLARYKVPKSVQMVEALPKSSVGKVLRREVREPFWRGREKRVHGAE